MARRKRPRPAAPRGAAAQLQPAQPGNAFWRVVRQPGAKIAAAAGAVVLAMLTAFCTTVAQRGADRLLATPAPSSAAPTSAAPLPFPFAVAVSTGFEDGMAYALPRPVIGGPDAEPLLLGFDDHDALAAYLRVRDGAPQRRIVPFFTFTGLVPVGATRIVTLRVHGKQAGGVLHGSTVNTVSQGESDTIPVHVDLDRPGLEVLDATDRPYFRQHDIELTLNEHEKFVVTFTAAKGCYRWVMAVDYVLADGTNRTAYVDATGTLHAKAADVPPGNRFALTGAAPAYGAVWDTNFPQRGFHLTRR
jgi:hypothetical protein